MPCRPSSPWFEPQTRSPGLNARHARADRLDTSGQIAAGDGRLGQCHRRGAGADVRVDRVDDAASDLTRTSPAFGLGVGKSPKRMTSGAPVVSKKSGFHGNLR